MNDFSINDTSFCPLSLNFKVLNDAKEWNDSSSPSLFIVFNLKLITIDYNVMRIHVIHVLSVVPVIDDIVIKPTINKINV